MADTQPVIMDPNDPPAFEKVWAVLQAAGERIDRLAREADRWQEEADRRQEEIDRRREEADRRREEIDRQMKETDKRVGELTNRFGDMVEHMVVPNLVSKFRALNFKFEQSSKDVVIRDEENGLFAEIDIFLQNGDKVMVVEIKATPATKDVDEHIERMELLRKYADLHKDFRKYRGAIAGVVFADSVRTYALKHGFYVVVPSGDTFDIIEPEGKYHVKEW
ncbi:MAG: hypothetical protein LBK27_03335 [Treponema sp.]|jgi:hypothetical protein|nr:hypothetical protein [Treponema sp.]